MSQDVGFPYPIVDMGRANPAPFILYQLRGRQENSIQGTAANTTVLVDHCGHDASIRRDYIADPNVR
jgi:hypothetical protein